MSLTPNIMMAGEGLIASTALRKVTANIDNYLTQTIVADYQNTILVWRADEYEQADGEGIGGNESGISQEIIDEFIHRLDDTAPYISNAAAEGHDEVTGDPVYYTQIFNQHVINLFPSNQQYVLYALIAMGQVDTSNRYVNSAKNAETLTEQTFTSQDALITGNLAALSTDINAWGEELVASGVLFDFSKLDNIGTPQAIVEALMAANMLGFISDELASQGLNVVTLARSIRDNPGLVLKPPVQKRCYDAFKLVYGAKLDSILELMQFITPGIVTLDELLDLRKVFPTTFATMTAPTEGTLQNIFTTAGNITDHFGGVTAPLQSVIPSTIAKSNYVFICALSQINGINNTTAAKLGNTAACMEDNTGLLYTGDLDVALPQSTIDSIIGSFGGGTGPNGTFYLTDLIGAPAALPYNRNITIMDNNFTTVQAAGGFDDIAEVLEVMRDVIGGVYDVIDNTGDESTFDYIEIPTPLPAEGTYNGPHTVAKELALTALLDELDLAVAAYKAAYPANHTALDTAFNSSYNGLVAGIKSLWDANVRFTTTYVSGYETNDTAQNGLPPSKSSTLLFSENLHQYGKRTEDNDIAEILETLAANTLGGNAIIAAMREGRNTDKLFDAGIKGDNEINEQS